MKLFAILIVFAAVLPGVALADDSGCDFEPPSQMLKAQAYAGQSFAAMADHTTVETASLSDGVRLTIRQSQCVDQAVREFVLTAPNDARKQDFAAWAGFTQGVLRDLKVRDAMPMRGLIDFLQKARTKRPKDGVVAWCLNGEVEDDCDWESGGKFSIEVKPGTSTTRITVYESTSG